MKGFEQCTSSSSRQGLKAAAFPGCEHTGQLWWAAQPATHLTDWAPSNYRPPTLHYHCLHPHLRPQNLRALLCAALCFISMSIWCGVCILTSRWIITVCTTCPTDRQTDTGSILNAFRANVKQICTTSIILPSSS